LNTVLPITCWLTSSPSHYRVPSSAKNLSESVDPCSHTAPQECVGKRSYADAVWVRLDDNPMTYLNPHVLKHGSLPATRVTRMTLNNCQQHQ
jgi:hypothetical protein